MSRKTILCLLLIFSCLALPSVAQDTPSTKSLGTTYLPLDHWAYPVLDRAIAMGALPTQFAGQRPWTRIAIAKLLAERRARPDLYANDTESFSMIVSLEREFAPELQSLTDGHVKSAELEQVYGRVQGIQGTPLRDSYHFGQTIVNDFGRPYGDGINGVLGASGHAEMGAFAIQLQGEFEHGASIDGYSSATLHTLGVKDFLASPILPNNNEKDRGALLDSYVSATWKKLYVSFGKESQWWGPGESGAMLMSNNAEPLLMLKVDLAEPITLPWILRYLGPMRLQLFNAKLDGHMYPLRPYLHGEKFSFMPTKNLELGFTRTTVWAGVGHPITLHSFLKTYLSTGDQPSSDLPQFDPGDRRGGFDVNYKVPGLRNWLTVYVDSLVDDDPSPLAAPNRAAFHPGFYLSHVPGLAKLDFRAEGAYTELPTETDRGGFFFYANGIYKDGYTEKGLLLGDWVGRDGKGGQVSSTYWLTPERTVQVYWRDHMIATDFLPGGGRQNDIGANLNVALGGHLRAAANVQYETYNIPLVAAGVKSNTSVGVTISYWPERHGQSK